MSQIAAPKRIDPHVTRTQLALRGALIALIREKGFAAVTVQDITARATVNRAMFYLHYADRFDLLNQNMKAMLDELVAEVDNISTQPSDKHDGGVRKVMGKFFEQIHIYRAFYSSLMGHEGVPALSQHARVHGAHHRSVFANASGLFAGRLSAIADPRPLYRRGLSKCGGMVARAQAASHGRGNGALAVAIHRSESI